MGIFNRKPSISDDDRFKYNLEQVAEDIGAENVFQHRVRYAHEDHDASRGEVSRKPSGPASGPSCDNANTPRPRRGRRW
ncbi:hypothetical protein CP980_16225 [Streptomyces vinaceus]|uniref:Uncharacterized protein n=1 Tax=Streptomyces vinaceus TaxID=1960 RepID=A0A5J6J998_STRVI|nr:hypothetical protein [Streptomyces vinaceus]QEV46442.1 hypothetical protein CP980_16225 [Streptomyces vinaceus]GHE76956.1 hypothetical protein GCM10017778_73410 [Streptomyces vinaceus]